MRGRLRRTLPALAFALGLSACVTSGPQLTEVPDEGLSPGLAQVHKRFVTFFDEAVFDRAPGIGGTWNGGRSSVVRWRTGSDMDAIIKFMPRDTDIRRALLRDGVRYLTIAGGNYLSPRSRALVEETIPRLQTATAMDIRFDPARHNANISIRAVSSDEIRKGRHVATGCYTNVEHRLGAIVTATIYVPRDRPEIAENCIIHELLHALGVTGHSHSMLSAISYAHESTSMTEWDYLLLSMLYRAVQPSTRRDHALGTVSAFTARLIRNGTKVRWTEVPLGPALRLVAEDKTGMRFRSAGIPAEPTLIFEGDFDDQVTSMTRLVFMSQEDGGLQARLDVLASERMSDHVAAFFSLKPNLVALDGDLARLGGNLKAINFDAAQEPVAGRPRILLLSTGETACLYFETGSRLFAGTVAADVKPGSRSYRFAGKYCRSNGQPFSEDEARSLVRSIGPPAGS